MLHYLTLTMYVFGFSNGYKSEISRKLIAKHTRYASNIAVGVRQKADATDL